MKVKKSNKRLCEGDKVIVIAGNDKGKTGTILSRKGDDKFIVQGVNIRKKHVKPTQEGKGNIIEIETPIHGSNIMLSPIEGKGVKLKVSSDKDQRQYVYNDDKGQEVVYRAANKKAK